MIHQCAVIAYGFRYYYMPGLKHILSTFTLIPHRHRCSYLPSPSPSLVSLSSSFHLPNPDNLSRFLTGNCPFFKMEVTPKILPFYILLFDFVVCWFLLRTLRLDYTQFLSFFLFFNGKTTWLWDFYILLFVGFCWGLWDRIIPGSNFFINRKTIWFWVFRKDVLKSLVELTDCFGVLENCKMMNSVTSSEFMML